MKVILTQELKGRGAEGDVIEVARGFAVNYLFPRRIAIEATPGNLKQLEARMHNIRKRDEELRTDADSLAARVDGQSVKLSAKVGEEGRLYGSITAQMIEDAVRDQLGLEIDRRKIETHGLIKELGDHQVEVQVYRDVKAALTVSVVAEGGVVVAQPKVEAVAEEAAAAPEEEFEADGETSDDDAEVAADEAAADEVPSDEGAELDAEDDDQDEESAVIE